MADSAGAAVALQTLGARLAQLRRAAGLSQHALAPLVHYTRSTVANVEVGRQHAPRAFWAACDQVLGTSSELVEAFDAIEQQRRQQTRSQSPLGELLRGDAGEASVDLLTVAATRDELRRLTQAYDTTASLLLLTPAAGLLAQASDHRTRAQGRVRREAFIAEAEARLLMGQLVWDASQRRDHAATTTHLQKAAELARQAADPLTEAYALLRLSFIGLYGTHRPRLGLAAASKAAKLARPSSPSLAALALLHVAEALAFLGQRSACDRTLDAAQEAAGRSHPDRDMLDAAVGSYSPTQHGRLAGSCYLTLGEHTRAESLLTATVQSLAAEQKISSLVLGNLALSRLRRGELDGALLSLHAAIDGLELTSSGAGLSVVFGAGRELRPWRAQPAVAEVHDRMLGLLSSP